MSGDTVGLARIIIVATPIESSALFVCHSRDRRSSIRNHSSRRRGSSKCDNDNDDNHRIHNMKVVVVLVLVLVGARGAQPQ